MPQEDTERAHTGNNMNSQLSELHDQKDVTENRKLVVTLTTAIASQRPQPGAVVTPAKEAGYGHPGETQDNSQSHNQSQPRLTRQHPSAATGTPASSVPSPAGLTG